MNPGSPSTNWLILTSLTHIEPATASRKTPPKMAIFAHLARLITRHVCSKVATVPCTPVCGSATCGTMALSLRLVGFGIAARALIVFDHTDDGFKICVCDLLNTFAFAIGDVLPRRWIGCRQGHQSSANIAFQRHRQVGVHRPGTIRNLRGFPDIADLSPGDHPFELHACHIAAFLIRPRGGGGIIGTVEHGDNAVLMTAGEVSAPEKGPRIDPLFAQEVGRGNKG